MKDENDTNTADLLRTVTTEPESERVLAIAGFGTGTVAELEHYIDQLRDERDAARRALADLERRTNSPDAIDGAELVDVITRIAERAAERVAGEIDGAAIWAEIAYLVEDAAEDATREVAAEAAAEVAAEVAADAARDVIRNELVVNVDLI